MKFVLNLKSSGCVGVICLTLLVLLTATPTSGVDLLDVKQKIRGDLASKILESPYERVTVLVQLESEENLDKVAKLIESTGGEVVGKYRIGDVIVAKLPAIRMTEVAKDASVRSISPNRIYSILLQDSVPQINAPYMGNTATTAPV